MRKISREEILAEIWKARGDQIVSWMIAKGEISIPYSFENFKRDMLRAELISDRRTICTKWDMLAASGVVRDKGKPYTSGELAFEPFRIRMSASAEDMLTSLIDKQRHTQTYTQTGLVREKP